MAGAAEANPQAENTGYRVADLIIDIGSQRVLRGDRDIPMPQLSFEFLLALTRAAPNVLSVDQLMERVWPGLVVGPETISQRVKLVRDALGDDSQAPRYIAGVRGRGYRMLAAVSPLEPLARAATFDATVTVSDAARKLDVAQVLEPAYAGSVSAAAARAAIVERSEMDVRVAHAPSTSSGRKWRRVAVGMATVVLLSGIGLILLARSLGWIHSGAPSSISAVVARQPPKTIAVLPLIDISPGGGNEYLGDGLAEELTDRLTRIPGVRVAARTSAFAFKGRPADVREIAQSLAVRHVLEGSVRREGDRLRVTTQLIDAQTGYHIWSHSYDRTWQDLLDIQDDIARSIVDALQLVLSSEIIERLEQGSTANLEAFDLYLEGLSKLHQQTGPMQLEEAERTFHAVLDVDPSFARGHAGLCETYAIWYERTRDTTMATKAEASCGKALSLDGSLREVETALASLYLVSGRAGQAAKIYQGILGRAPNDADAYLGLAQAYEDQRRLEQAEATYRRAIEVEPSYANLYQRLGTFLFNHGRAGEAVTQYRRVTELKPTSAYAFNNLGTALQMTGEFEQAARALERSLELEPTRSAYSNMGTLYYFLGRFADAEKMYRKATEMASADHRTRGNLADALYQIDGRRTEAKHEYERAIALAQADLSVSSTDAVGWAQLGYYYARIGDSSRSLQATAHAVELGSDAVYVQYYAALSALESDDFPAAINALHKAIEAGYPVQFIRAGPEFSRLRGDERFRRLLASHDRPGAG